MLSPHQTCRHPTEAALQAQDQFFQANAAKGSALLQARPRCGPQTRPGRARGSRALVAERRTVTSGSAVATSPQAGLSVRSMP